MSEQPTVKYQKTLVVKPYTVIGFVGPSQCGKTHLAQRWKGELKGEWPKLNVQHIGSDQWRRQLLGNEQLHKHSRVMMEVSAPAFRMLMTHLECAMEVHAEVILLDTTGLSQAFRQEVAELAEKQCYTLQWLVWDYKNSENYFQWAPEDDYEGRKVVSQHVSRLKQQVMKELRGSKVCIKSPEIADIIKVQYDSVSLEECMLDPSRRYLIVGDVHGCVQPLEDLLTKCGFAVGGGIVKRQGKTQNTDVIFVGNVIDTTREMGEMLGFLSGNLNSGIFHFVMGDQEMKFMEMLKSGHPCDETVKGQFMAVYEQMKPFRRYVSVDVARSFVVTHAPCDPQHAGKLDERSVMRQVKGQLGKASGEAIREHLQRLLNTDGFNKPLHVSGHFAHMAEYFDRNHYHMFINTGCSQGGRLTAVVLGKGVDKPMFRSVKGATTEGDPPVLLNLRAKKDKTDEEIMTRWDTLTEKQQKRIRQLINRKINFISGTIAPAACDPNTHDIESLEDGLRYYYALDNKMMLSIQPKYMGSRCQVYLRKDPEDCMATSRNGYTIKNVDMTAIYASLWERLGPLMERDGIEMMIIDGELMPWRALGGGLIDETFKTIESGISSELEFLHTAGFEEEFAKLTDRMVASGFDKMSKDTKKADLISRFGQADYNTFRSLQHYQHVSLKDAGDAFDIYRKQLELYAGDGPVEYKPFGILKMVYTDGSEEIVSVKGEKEIPTFKAFSLVSDDPQLVITWEEGFAGALQKALAFFATITQKMEGIVIKPALIDPGCAPFIKVRNPRYLTIIYGYDYLVPSRLENMIKNKRTGRKLHLSIKEFQLGLKLLKTKAEDMNTPQYTGLLMDFLKLEGDEKQIDPRL